MKKDSTINKFLNDVSTSTFQEASKEAMKKHGYIVIAYKGFVVKKFSNGKIEKIKKI